MKKKIVTKVVAISICIIIVLSAISIVDAYRNSDYKITYEVKEGSALFHLKYSSVYFANVGGGVDNMEVVVMEEESSKARANILSDIGILRKKEDILFKVKGDGTAKITLTFSGRHTDDLYINDYNVQVSGGKVSISSVNE